LRRSGVRRLAAAATAAPPRSSRTPRVFEHALEGRAPARP